MNNPSEYVMARKPLPWDGITDVHTHLIGDLGNFYTPSTDADSMVKEMDRIGIEKTLCSHIVVGGPESEYGNNEVLNAMKKHRNRILGYVVTYPIVDKLGILEVKRCMDRGMSGIKLHSHYGIPYTSSHYREIWEFANENKLPILLHTFTDTNLDALEVLFQEFSNAKIILAHAGCANPELYAHYAKKYDNVFLEASHSAAPYFIYEYFVSKVCIRKILFGSDFALHSLGHQLGRLLFAGITEQQKKAILVENPRQLLKE